MNGFRRSTVRTAAHWLRMKPGAFIMRVRSVIAMITLSMCNFIHEI
jgi:hypothetical protein